MVVVLTGKNDHKIQQKLKSLVETFKNDNGDSIERFDGSEMLSLDPLIDAVRSVSLLNPIKLVIVRNFAQHKELLDDIENLKEQTAKSTQLILVDKKLDKRTAAYKFLQKTTDMSVFVEENPYELSKWLVDRAQQQGSEISGQNANLLVDRVGSNQMLLNQEIKKLSIKSDKISRQDILDLTEQTPQSKVFDMLDRLFAGEGGKAWKIYLDQRKQGEEPQKIIAMITWQLQQLALAVFAPSRDKNTLVSAGMSPYTAQKSLSMAKHISKKDLKHYIMELAELDSKSKINADIESTLSVYFADVAASQATS